MPLINNIGCIDSYIKFICKTNFRGCDIISKILNKILANTTKEMCQSVCDNYLNYCDTLSNLCSKLPTIDYSENKNCYK